MSLFNTNSKKKAFSSLYDELYDLLYPAFLKIIKDEARTKDILQEAFIKLWNNWDQIDSNSDLRPLVYTYAKNLFLDDLRKTKMRRQKEEAALSTASKTATGEDIVRAKQVQESIDRSVSKMPAAMQRVFILSRERRLSNKEIAAQLSISSFTVKRHLQDALHFLKRDISRQ
ncbi:RNA polymerase sigma factor [Niabella beijingensis]|uniref:RNA polymerase sigma factor n=1 Tax=Niabella beijingensis TaxID=2872700 RepID=UPI001CBF78CA|nr:sigma-70 family RNA polymerase sigma factor [Niabella beijingensis]MBZ4188009.1 sigma-70 family RNA polymerase sigma factor [Niabella beijingensis]